MKLVEVLVQSVDRRRCGRARVPRRKECVHIGTGPNRFEHFPLAQRMRWGRCMAMTHVTLVRIADGVIPAARAKICGGVRELVIDNIRNRVCHSD